MERITTGAKFFFYPNGSKFHLQGVSYGPFEPHRDTPFKSPALTEHDFTLIKQAGFNTLRLYHAPPEWFLDLAAQHNLYVLITVPWEKRVLFLDDSRSRRATQANLRALAQRYQNCPALLGYLVDNEIPPDLVRWYGARSIERYINSLVQSVKEIDAGALCSYATYPPTEYLLPWDVDFYCYNVYLHNPERLRAYLGRLQNIAEDKPLILGEFGMETANHTEEEQANLLTEHYEAVFRSGLAGTILFAWTDEWFTDGVAITNWPFGIVRADRSAKKSYHALTSKTIRPKETLAQKFALSSYPLISVVVCSYNGAFTLRGCMDSLQKLHYPNYEVILVDDGSIDSTQQIMRDFPKVRNIVQENKGLSVARNVGIAASRGEIVAFTDSDCEVDVDWLYYLAQTFLTAPYAAVGGPNISPPARTRAQAIVAVTPGGPSHVLLDDQQAEHIPGCNMAFRRAALHEVGGFDPEFRKAGDDVDICWKLIRAGYSIGFSPAAIVWHYRRFTVRAFFCQQAGYGEAEALLRYKHFQFFDASGTPYWKGVIYGQPRLLQLFHPPLIYHGLFGMGFFQQIYKKQTFDWRHQVHRLEWLALALVLLFFSWKTPMLWLAPLLMVLATLAAALIYTIETHLEKKYDNLAGRFLLFYLVLSQPLVREWNRYFTWVRKKKVPKILTSSHKSQAFYISWPSAGHLAFYNEKGVDRSFLLEQLIQNLRAEGWLFVLDTGWKEWDIQIFAHPLWHIQLKTLTEIYPHGRRVVRVGNYLVCSTFSAIVAIIVLLLAVTICSFCPSYVLFFSIVYNLLMISWLGKGFWIRSRVAQSIQQAAHKANFQRIERL